MLDRSRLSFGIKTTPAAVAYDDVLRVWEEADKIPLIEHAWLWDHMVPIFGERDVPTLEGWTLLAALAARTERLGLGLLVTSNRTRLPSVLAKMAATVDVVSGGRLVVGIGVGATDLRHAPGQEFAVREYEAYGMPLVSPKEGRESLAEACMIMKRMWTEDVFDFHGRHYTLKGAVCEPKPVQRPGPPILIGSWGDQGLRVVAEHADIWNIPGPPHQGLEFLRDRSRVLDEHCAAIGRDPNEIVRSTQLMVSYDDPRSTRAVIDEVVDAGFTHLVLSPLPPYPPNVAQWLTEEFIAPVLATR